MRFPVLLAACIIIINSASLTPLAAGVGRAFQASQGRSAERLALRNCQSPPNRVVAENCKPGNPSTEWDVNGSGDPKIQGFATDISINAGETISFKVGSDSPAYRIDLYRLGYYGGAGARLVATIKPSVPLPQKQPECLRDESVRLYDCGNWQVSASWFVPRDAMSGIYIARLVREDSEPPSWRPDNGRAGREGMPQPGPHAYGALGLGRPANALKEPRASHIYFIVRDDVAGKQDRSFGPSAK